MDMYQSCSDNWIKSSQGAEVLHGGEEFWQGRIGNKNIKLDAISSQWSCPVQLCPSYPNFNTVGLTGSKWFHSSKCICSPFHCPHIHSDPVGLIAGCEWFHARSSFLHSHCHMILLAWQLQLVSGSMPPSVLFLIAQCQPGTVAFIESKFFHILAGLFFIIHCYNFLHSYVNIHS